MDKQELLVELNQMLASGEVSRDELLAATQGSMPQATLVSQHAMNLSEVMYYIGGGIVFLGICVLCYQNWDSFSSFLRIFITLGSCIAAGVVAVLLNRYENYKKMSQAFFMLFGVLAPLGLGVTFKEMGLDLSVNFLWVGLYAILTAVFLGMFYYYKEQTILFFFGIVFATSLFHYIIVWMVGDTLLLADYSKVWEYQFLVIGLVYMLLGYYVRQTLFKGLTGALYGFGCLFFLASTLALGGWQPTQNAFWELVYPLIVFGIIFLSVYIKSKSFLVFGSLFLIAYIMKLTGEYFTSGLGWPLALVLAGLIIMVIGYYAVKINKQYLTTIK